MNGVVCVVANVEVTIWNARTPRLERLARLGRGRVFGRVSGHNLVVLAGHNLVRDFLHNLAPVGLTQFAIGTNGTAVADGNTALGTEVLRGAITQYVAGSSTLLLKYFLSTTQLNGSTLREAGLFNAASGPTMFARYVIDPAIVKDNTIAVTFAWNITITSG